MELDEDGQPARTLDVDDVPKETKRSVSDEDIEDRSKGDVLSKGFALLQTGWFILQSIARKLNGFPVTQLEVVTVAFAVLNFAMYIVWWKKPQNVSHPIRVCNKGENRGELRGKREAGQGWARRRSSWTEFKRGLADIPKEIHRPIVGLVHDFGPGSIIAFPMFPFWPILFADSYKKNPKRVGTFSPKTIGNSTYPPLMSVAARIVFGGIHCIAWAVSILTPNSGN